MISNLIDVYTDGATVGYNGKLGTVKEVGLGLYIPSEDYGDAKKVKGISNNEAEFKALIWGMETCIEQGLTEVRFNMDSQIVVNRANGRRAKGKHQNSRMDAFQDRVIGLTGAFKQVEFKHIPREQNEIADHYSNLAKEQELEEV